jgi:hypothetical protein
MDFDQVVRNFRDTLVVGYANWRQAAVVACERERGFLDEAFGDWAQAHWELLVERVVLGPHHYLDLYRVGSDYEQAAHSRVFFHQAEATHKVAVTSRSGGALNDVLTADRFTPDDYEFDGFMAHVGDWFEEEPPFDHVLLSAGEVCRLVMADEVRFELVPVP